MTDFAATSSALYVDNGTQLVTYSLLRGPEDCLQRCRCRFTKSYAATPVIDSVG